MAKVLGCPTDYAKSVFNTVKVIEFFQKGMPPIQGGILDQSASFLRAASFFEHDEQELKHE